MSATLCSIFLVCRDLPTSTEFYLSLGFGLLKSGDRTSVFGLTDQNSDLQLHLHAQLTEEEQAEYAVGWQKGSRGLVLSFQVDALEQLIASAPPDSVLVPPRVAPWGTRLALLIDPDGYRLEFQERLKPQQ